MLFRGRLMDRVEKAENRNLTSKQPATWSSCLIKNKSRIRNRILKKDNLLPNDGWQNLITDQRAKFKRLYNDDYAWRVLEYETLERLNNWIFPQETGYLWKAAISRQTKKFRMRSEVLQIQTRGSRYRFIEVQRAKRKKLILNKLKIETYWSLCFEGQKMKLDRYFNQGWIDRISDQKRKLWRMILSH